MPLVFSHNSSMANIPKHSKRGNELPDGDYEVTLRGYPYAMKLITRNRQDGTSSRVLMVVSSNKWFHKTGNEWSGFAFYHSHSNGLYVWHKFRGTRKRKRDWDGLADAFREQVMAPAMAHEEIITTMETEPMD